MALDGEQKTALPFEKTKGVTSDKQHTATTSTHVMLLLLSLQCRFGHHCTRTHLKTETLTL
jgi:hypothetical protein